MNTKRRHYTRRHHATPSSSIRKLWRRLMAHLKHLGIALLAIIVTAVLIYFIMPGIFYGIYYRALGTYRPTTDEVYDGIDVSHHNGMINWPQVASDTNIKFVYIKATEGYKHLDKLYHYNIENARQAGIKTGSYHLLTTKTSMHTQFNYFKQNIDIQQQDLIPMLDIEENKVKQWSRRQVQDSIAKLIKLFQDHYDVAPVIYCSYKFYKNKLYPAFDDQILFLARYGKQEPALDGDKKQHDIWQFTEHGHINGISGDVDLNRFGSNTSLSDISY